MCQGPEAGPSLARGTDRERTKVAGLGGAGEIEAEEGVREKPDPSSLAGHGRESGFYS